MEFFLPHFNRPSKSIQAEEDLQEMLLSPAFDPRDSGYIDKVVSVARRVGERKSDSQALEAALQKWMDARDLQAAIEANPDHWSSRNARAVQRTELSTSAQDERRSLARRLYGIRCRIVHAKFAVEEPPILPFTDEADWLRYDIQLAELVAQKAIIHHADN
jgi:hypothetical protein